MHKLTDRHFDAFRENKKRQMLFLLEKAVADIDSFFFKDIELCNKDAWLADAYDLIDEFDLLLEPRDRQKFLRFLMRVGISYWNCKPGIFIKHFLEEKDVDVNPIILTIRFEMINEILESRCSGYICNDVNLMACTIIKRELKDVRM